jgi:hypothetical protein
VREARPFKELNRFFNMAAYNPSSRDDRDNYLFWIGWTAHVTTSLLSTSDASGPFRPTAITLNCETLRDTLREQPGFAAAFGFLDASSGVVPFLDGGICPDSGESSADEEDEE